MELVNVLRMKGGLGELSYANNSLVQRKGISMTKQMREEAITELYTTLVPKTMGIADLGCSSGPSALLVSNELVEFVDNLCRELGHPRSPEFQIYLNDLPSNDFNFIFQSLLPEFRVKEIGRCFVHGVPGTFHGRLFASQTLHFVHSSCSIHWLSKVPEVLKMNKEKIYITSRSPREVIDAYYKQFQRDFSTFLKCRSEEVVPGGKMVVTMMGRKSDDPCSKEGCYLWELFAMALQEMVSEGVVEEEKLHSFNIPQYVASPKEVGLLVEEEGSFTINRLESSEINLVESSPEYMDVEDGYKYMVAKNMRSVVEALVLQHFGEIEIDRLSDKYAKILCARLSNEDAKLVNVTVSLTRK